MPGIERRLPSPLFNMSEYFGLEEGNNLDSSPPGLFDGLSNVQSPPLPALESPPLPAFEFPFSPSDTNLNFLPSPNQAAQVEQSVQNSKPSDNSSIPTSTLQRTAQIAQIALPAQDSKLSDHSSTSTSTLQRTAQIAQVALPAQKSAKRQKIIRKSHSIKMTLEDPPPLVIKTIKEMKAIASQKLIHHQTSPEYISEFENLPEKLKPYAYEFDKWESLKAPQSEIDGMRELADIQKRGFKIIDALRNDFSVSKTENGVTTKVIPSVLRGDVVMRRLRDYGVNLQRERVYDSLANHLRIWLIPSEHFLDKGVKGLAQLRYEYANPKQRSPENSALLKKIELCIQGLGCTRVRRISKNHCETIKDTYPDGRFTLKQVQQTLMDKQRRNFTIGCLQKNLSPILKKIFPDYAFTIIEP